jgi:Tfp pilus assembly protein PilV
MIIALTVVILSSLKSAQYGENQIKATKYAQDALDKIKMMRDINANTLKQDDISTSVCFANLWTDNTTYNCLGSTECFFNLSTTGQDLVKKANLNSSKEDLKEGFSRYIIMDNKSGGEIRITAKVVWSDSSGAHESKVQTILIQPSYECQTAL